MIFVPVIGLEIHCQLKTKTKMFCCCLNHLVSFEKQKKITKKKANSNICPICLGHPGTLPTVNLEAIKKTIKLGLALNCKIASSSKFDRKSYFYPDLPKGYQISQYDMPFCQEGFLEIEVADKIKKIRINRIHLEEDTGKLIHQKDCSLIDFNRAGTPLLELVTEPEITSEIEAKVFAQELKLILKHLDISEANMEKGQMRIEANISLTPINEKIEVNNPIKEKQVKSLLNKQKKILGTKVEIKNLNSFRALEEAIRYEIKRQKTILKKGEKVIQETRGWNENKKTTVSQRIKEGSSEYRYFPEPDLPIFFIRTTGYQKIPLIKNINIIDALKIKSEIFTLPQERRDNLVKKDFLSKKNAQILIEKEEIGSFFAKIVLELDLQFKKDSDQLRKLKKIIANYLINILQPLQEKRSIKKVPISVENFIKLAILIDNKTLSSKTAKTVVEHLLQTNEDPLKIIKREKLSLINDKEEIVKIVKRVIKENPEIIKKYHSGKLQVLQFLIGQIIKKSDNKVDPALIKKFLLTLL